MRIVQLIFVGFVGALVATTPALAKNSKNHSEAGKAEDQSTSASCHAYQQAADGTWTALPCEEAGGTHTQNRGAARGPAEEPR